jgi:hypothetical protein
MPLVNEDQNDLKDHRNRTKFTNNLTFGLTIRRTIVQVQLLGVCCRLIPQHPHFHRN